MIVLACFFILFMEKIPSNSHNIRYFSSVMCWTKTYWLYTCVYRCTCLPKCKWTYLYTYVHISAFLSTWVHGCKHVRTIINMCSFISDQPRVINYFLEFLLHVCKRFSFFLHVYMWEAMCTVHVRVLQYFMEHTATELMFSPKLQISRNITASRRLFVLI